MRDPVRKVVFPRRRVAELRVSAPEARTLAPDEVAGPTRASVVSAGTELGMQYDAEEGFPHEPGYGAVFAVEELGTAVADLAPGDLVFCIGEHASWQRHRRADLVPVPPGLPPEVAVLTRMIVIGRAARLLDGAAAERVLVTGLGPVGHFTARLLLREGCAVAAVDPDPARRELLGRFADPAIFPAVPADDPGWHERIDLACECSGRAAAVLDACRSMRRGGRLLLVGVPWRRLGDESPAREILWKAFWRRLHLRGAWEAECAWEEGYREACAGILDLLAGDDFPVDGLYRTVAPAACDAVYRELLEGVPPALCTVFVW